MSTLRKIAKGFTLIELMIVVAIIGILAAIAIPNFVKFQCRSKQSEAKGNLKSLYVAEESYRAEYDEYYTSGVSCSGSNCTTESNDVGFAPKGNRIRYAYTTTAGGGSTWGGSAVPATGFSSELGGDQWTISEKNDITNAINGCK